LNSVNIYINIILHYKMIFIPIGIDCFFAGLLKDNNLRKFALPFDWCVTYSGVSKIINDNFDKFIPKDKIQLNKEYDMVLNHYFQDSSSKDKYERRIARLKNILENSKEELIFIRKGHSTAHHKELNGNYEPVKSDIEDAIDLNNILRLKYPHLKYKIIIFLMCHDCFDINKTYHINENIKIYNISVNAQTAAHDKLLKETFLKNLKDLQC